MPGIFNFIIFYLVWLVVIVSASKGFSSLGIVISLVMVLFHLRDLSFQYWLEIKIILVVALLGTLIDSINPLLGLVIFATKPEIPWGYTLWMSSLWMVFGTTFSTSLKWLQGKYLTASILGAVGGPISYYSGYKLEALFLKPPIWIPLLITSLVWAVSMPLFLYIYQSFCKRGTNTVSG